MAVELAEVYVRRKLLMEKDNEVKKKKREQINKDEKTEKRSKYKKFFRKILMLHKKIHLRRS
ncbi:hypothetical protein HPP92_004312 [Vanilla planifolia]|uniref:Uncharacterized protein n=1 Tax=Vanilla planifolia TaxID=51239 RepID=A0A835S449_VANPL|nr:hypothetical protein HPP92_004312 [Vanilla planifolia]